MSAWIVFNLPLIHDIPYKYIFVPKGVISREKRISLPPVKDVFTKVVAKNNQNRKAFIRNITLRR